MCEVVWHGICTRCTCRTCRTASPRSPHSSVGTFWRGSLLGAHPFSAFVAVSGALSAPFRPLQLQTHVNHTGCKENCECGVVSCRKRGLLPAPHFGPVVESLLCCRAFRPDPRVCRAFYPPHCISTQFPPPVVCFLVAKNRKCTRNAAPGVAPSVPHANCGGFGVMLQVFLHIFPCCRWYTPCKLCPMWALCAPGARDAQKWSQRRGDAPAVLPPLHSLRHASFCGDGHACRAGVRVYGAANSTA